MNEHEFPSADVPEENKVPTHKIFMQLGRQNGGAVAFLQADNALSSQEEEIFLNMTNAVKNAIQNYSKEAISEISAAATSKDYSRLCEILGSASFRGKFYFASQDTLKQIVGLIGPLSIDGLPLHQAEPLLETKLLCAERLCIYTGLYDDITVYLREFEGEIDEAYKQTLTLAQASCAAQEGKADLAYGLYRHVIEAAKEPLTLAWAHRGLVHTMDPLDPDALYHEDLAGSYFLQGGNVRDYIGAKMRCAGKVEFSNPQSALKMLDDALAVCDPKDDQYAEYIIQLQLRKSKIYDRIGKEGSAFDEVQTSLNSIDLQRCYGLEPLQIAVYNLLILIEEKRGNAESNFAQDARCNIASLEQRLQTEDKPEYEVRKKLIEALSSRDPDKLQSLKPEIDACQDPLLDVIYIIVNVLISNATFIERLEQLEQLRPYIDSKKIPLEVTVLIYALYADSYLKNCDNEKALSWYKKALDIDPFLWPCRQNYAAILWNENRWTEAADFFEKQIERFGDQPNLLTAYGRALIETGNYGKALITLRKAQKMQPDSQIVSEYLNMALDSCSEDDLKAETANKQSIESSQVLITPEGFKHFLSEFSDCVQSEVRMTFWRLYKGKTHTWRPAPEQQGQTLLHMFIKSKYGDAVEALEEVGTGAGRMDLYLHFSSGFKTIIELKMCGHGYSEAYSLEGIQQLDHYLKSQKVHVGYLLVFDSRTRDFGKGIESVYFVDDNIIFTSIIDVRPSTKPQKGEKPWQISQA